MSVPHKTDVRHKTDVSPQADWWSHAACRTADPELFFPISAVGPATAEIATAKAVCARCGVRRECLTFALATRQVHGVWGGTSPEERQVLRERAGKPVWVTP
jgi:WhiB family transcriptional regulator, redox-sensing transcriptional regulator